MTTLPRTVPIVLPKSDDVVEISVIIPFYNEEGGIDALYADLAAALVPLSRRFEIICVNDGSRDRTAAKLDALAARDRRVKVIHLLRNFGQTAATMAAIDHASGDIIVGLDGDGQNDPADIARLIDKLDEGFDVVSGWRRDRKDNGLTRKLPSMLANRLISRVSGVHLHDYGCTLKAYRRSVIASVRLYGEMHRFIPIYTSWLGGKVTEIEVNHRPRSHGASKYGLSRVFKVVLDLLLVRFLDRHLTKPIHFFGGLGLLSILLGFASGAWAVWLKLGEGVSFIQTPLPLLVVMLFVTGIMLVLMGVLAELVVRTYFEAQGKATYIVRERRNIDEP